MFHTLRHTVRENRGTPKHRHTNTVTYLGTLKERKGYRKKGKLLQKHDEKNMCRNTLRQQHKTEGH